MEEIEFQHSSDPLENLTYLVGRCIVCGCEHREALMGEVKQAFMICRCGNIVEGLNKTLWN
jgi:hypothetical protein